MIPPLPDRVKEAVSEAHKEGLTVAQIASACGVSVQTVYDWKKGKTINLKGETLVELAEVSRLNARWIINGRGEKLGLSKDERIIVDAFPYLEPSMRKMWLSSARDALELIEVKKKVA